MADLSELSQDDQDAIAIAKAKAAAAAQRKQPDNSWSGMGKEALRSAGEGIAGLGDFPNWVGNKITQAGPGAEYLPGGEADLPKPEAPTPAPSSRYNASFPITPGYENSWTREVGNIAGPTALTLGIGSAPAIVEGIGARGVGSVLAREVPKLVADTVFTTGTTVAGKEGGGVAGQFVGGDTGRQWGEAIGSLVGGSMTPILSNAASRLTTEANSLLRLKNARAAGVEKPDLSLVGSRWASRRGNPANQEIQQGQIDQSLLDLSQDMRRNVERGPVQPPTRPISETKVGQGVIDLSKQGAERAAADAETTYRTGLAPIDQNAPIPSEASALTTLSKNAEPTVQQPLIDAQQKAIDASRYKNANTAPRLLDPSAHPALEANVTLRQNELDRLTQARADPARIKTAESDLARAKADLDANFGTTFSDVKVRRGEVRRTRDAGGGDPYILNQIYDAQTNAMRDAAIQRGVTAEEFDAVNQTYATLKDRQAALEKIAAKKEGPAYSEVFGTGGEKNVSTLEALQQNADPQALGRILADNLELRTRGAPVAGRPELPIDTGLNSSAAVKWWEKLDPAARDAYFAPGTQERIKMDAVIATMKADARRGGYQVEPSDNLTAPAGLGALATGHPVTAAAIMAPRVGSALFGRLMQSPRFTEAMINRRGNPLTPLDLARTIAASVGASQQ